jgi:hypothetical protein
MKHGNRPMAIRERFVGETNAVQNDIFCENE